MDFELSPDQRLLRDKIIQFAGKELNEGAADRDRTETFSRGLWLKCGDMGLQGLPVPEEFGGTGLDPLSTAVALEAFGYGCRDGGLVFSVCAHLLACVVPVLKHGSDDLKRRYLPGLCNGTFIAVTAMTEPSSGSDVFAISTRAERDGDGFRITGTKIFGTNAPVADLALVYAVTDRDKAPQGGVTGFLVKTDTPGVQQAQKFEKMGLRSSMLGELVFEDVFVPADAVVGSVGSGTVVFAESMEWERVCIAASQVGTMQHLMEKSIAYARTRTSAGRTIGKYQAVSHKIANMKIRLEASRLLTYRSASRIGQTHRNASDASITKVFASEALVKTALDTVQVLGGYGYLTEYEAERALRDAIGSPLYCGTNEIQRNIIAGWLGL
jgi:alkylation response protein AidB-like acyl-CoA dehydrogenase